MQKKNPLTIFNFIFLLLFIFLMGCTASEPSTIVFHKPGATWEQTNNEVVACGAMKLPDGSGTSQSDEVMQQIALCMTKKGYQMAPGAKMTWNKKGASEEQLTSDFLLCGGKFHSLGFATFDRGKLPAIDKCMREKGYMIERV